MREDGFVLFEALPLVWLRALIINSDGDRDSNTEIFIMRAASNAE